MNHGGGVEMRRREDEQSRRQPIQNKNRIYQSCGMEGGSRSLNVEKTLELEGAGVPLFVEYYI